MNPLLEAIYSTIIPSAPFIIAAYALVWVALFVFVIIAIKGFKNSEKQLAVLEEEVEKLKTK
ncbi:MAG: hypothetical protein J6Y65_02145 [Eggerthellaceae bacterium]|nr:hypothetical protein [Eggerthellaceae bacterium]